MKISTACIKAYLKSTTPVSTFIFISLLLLTPALFAVILEVEFNTGRHLRYNSLLALLSLLVCLPRNVDKLLLILVSSIYSLLSLLEIGHLLIFKSWTTQNVFFTIFESHSAESLEFFETYLYSSNGIIIISVLCFWVGAIFLLKKIDKKFQIFNTALVALSLLGWILLLTSFNKTSQKLLTFTPLQTYKFLDHYLTEAESLVKSNTTIIPKDYLITADKLSLDQTIVIVIGESTSRNKMSLYGYERDTTPLLKDIKDELIIFENVISPDSHTKPSLEKVLTFKNNETQHPIDAPNLIRIANLSEYKTYWISNQVALGEYETPTTAIAKSADILSFPSTSKNQYDQVLFTPFEKALRDNAPKKIIFLHLMGAHTKYASRYPQEFDVFKDSFTSGTMALNDFQQELYNSYDNAILYNDWIVKGFIDLLKKADQKNSLLVYFSDHAEEVFDYRDFHGHTEAIQSNYMFEIPFLIWLSESHERRDVWKSITQNRLSSLYSIEDFIHTFHDLLDIKSRDYQGRRSIISPHFEVIPRLAGKQLYKNSSYVDSYPITKNDLNFRSKVMIHRVNSIEMFKEAISKVPAVEVDLLYDETKKIFDVSHPPVASIGLSFEEYLILDQGKEIDFWLDFKNLDSTNIDSVITLLKTYDEKFNIKNRIVFESPNKELLKKISSNGFKTSWYLPTFTGTEKWEEILYVENIKKELSNDLSAISQDYKTIKMLKGYLKNLNFLTWNAGNIDKLTPNQLKDFQEDQQTKIFLVKMDSKFRR